MNRETKRTKTNRLSLASSTEPKLNASNVTKPKRSKSLKSETKNKIEGKNPKDLKSNDLRTPIDLNLISEPSKNRKFIHSNFPERKFKYLLKIFIVFFFIAILFRYSNFNKQYENEIFNELDHSKRDLSPEYKFFQLEIEKIKSNVKFDSEKKNIEFNNFLKNYNEKNLKIEKELKKLKIEMEKQKNFFTTKQDSENVSKNNKTELENTEMNEIEKQIEIENKIDQILSDMIKFETFNKDNINDLKEESKNAIKAIFDEKFSNFENQINFLFTSQKNDFEQNSGSKINDTIRKNIYNVVKDVLEDDQIQNLILKKLKNEIDHFDYLNPSKESIYKIVKDSIFSVVSESVEQPDYALYKTGGRPFYSKTKSEQTLSYSSWISLIFGNTRSVYKNDPKIALDASMSPGDCWSFAGSKANFTVKLSCPIIPTAFTIDHISRKLSFHPESAPKSLKVYGLNEINFERYFLSVYEYDNSGQVSQTFQVSSSTSIQFKIIQLEINSNHGYHNTCLYRFRVHGIPSNSC